jgi:hypothetical protein
MCPALACDFFTAPCAQWIPSHTVPGIQENRHLLSQPVQVIPFQVTFKNTELHPFTMVFQNIMYLFPDFVVADVISNHPEPVHLITMG